MLQLVAASAFGIVIGIVVRGQPSVSLTIANRISSAILLLLIIAATAPGLWPHALSLYPGDSHHTLPGFSGLGVFLVATMLAIGGVAIVPSVTGRVWRSNIGLPIWVLAPATALLIFALASLIIPQIFYTLYLVIFEGLPLQWVIEPGQTIRHLISVFFWQPGQSMSSDGAAITLHTMLLVSLIQAARLSQLNAWIIIPLLSVLRLALNLPSMIAF